MDLSTFDFTSLFVKKYVQNSIYTAMPAAITSVASLETEQVISVKPLVKNEYEDGVILNLPDVLNVPVVFPAGGGGLLSFPLKVGNQVLLVFSMRSISEYLNAVDGHDKAYLPDTARNHDLSDAIAIPSMFGKNNNLGPDPDHVELKFAGSSVKLKDDGDVTVDAAKDIIATAVGKAEVTAPTINLIGDVTITGTLDVNGSAMNHNGTNVGDTHTHEGSPTAAVGSKSDTGAPN